MLILFPRLRSQVRLGHCPGGNKVCAPLILITRGFLITETDIHLWNSDLASGMFSPESIYNGLRNAWRIALDHNDTAQVLALTIPECGVKSANLDKRRDTVNSSILAHEEPRLCVSPPTYLQGFFNADFLEMQPHVRPQDSVPVPLAGPERKSETLGGYRTFYRPRIRPGGRTDCR